MNSIKTKAFRRRVTTNYWEQEGNFLSPWQSICKVHAKAAPCPFFHMGNWIRENSDNIQSEEESGDYYRLVSCVKIRVVSSFIVWWLRNWGLQYFLCLVFRGKCLVPWWVSYLVGKENMELVPIPLKIRGWVQCA